MAQVRGDGGGAERMKIEIPAKMWEEFKERVELDNYCFLCDCHPSSGHDKSCPLFVAVPEDIPD